jgi:DNA-binding NarL/FixJ family response regulator
VEKARELRPNITILDIRMPNLNGIEAARRILEENPATRILILTVADTEQAAAEALRAGARGFILKSDAAVELISAVQALQAGHTYFSPSISEFLLKRFLREIPCASEPDNPVIGLTSREREVIQLIAEGKTTKEVSLHLGITTKTVETHRANIMRKLNLHSVRDLVLYAIKNNIIHIPVGEAACLGSSPSPDGLGNISTPSNQIQNSDEII